MNKNRKVRLLILLFSHLLMFNNILTGQTVTPYQPNVLPPSPNVSSLLKYIDVPVSPYTGTADVSIPIYTIQAKGKSVPISLQYHTGGIRVKEESGIVGLGWALNSGGVISRTIFGKDDFLSGVYFNAPVPEIHGRISAKSGIYTTDMGDYGFDFFCNYNVPTADSVFNFRSLLNTSNLFYDAEPDVYQYSYPGGSGKFIIDRNRNVILQKQGNLKFLFDVEGKWFKITDEWGTQYFYNDVEIITTNADPARSISSWQLSKIITPQKDSIIYTYVTDSTWTSASADINETYRTGCSPITGLTSIVSSPNLYLNNSLQRIDFANGRIQFAYDTVSRNDLTAAKRLTGIQLFSRTQSSTLFLREFRLFHSYFNSEQSDALEHQRLRLDSVQERSGSLTKPPYRFEYHLPSNSLFTGKHSFAVDHWGYYNGKPGNTTYIPKFSGVYNSTGSSVFVQLDGAERSADPASTKVFSLNKIYYPTGGSTQLEYESNDYDETKSINGPQDFPEKVLVDTSVTINYSGRGILNGNIDFSKIYQAAGMGNNLSVTITFRSNNNDSCAPFRNTYDKIYVDFAGIHRDISSTTLSCPLNTPICTSNTIGVSQNAVSASPYTLHIDSTIGSGFAGITMIVRWQELKTLHSGNPTLLGGGLRIKSISENDMDGILIKKRQFDYTYQVDRNGDGVNEAYSSGRLMAYPSYARYEPILISQPGSTYWCESLTRYSSSNTTLTSAIQGNVVGYDRVSEYLIDPVSGKMNGKTEYRYYNQSDSVFSFNGFRLPGLFSMGNSLNGIQLSKVVYSYNGSQFLPVQSVLNFYRTRDRLVFYSMKANYLSSGSGHSNSCPGDSAVNYQYLANFYPSIKSEKILLDSTIEMVYGQETTVAPLVTTTKYYYDNPLHSYVTRSSRNDSKGNLLVTQRKYPLDYLQGGSSNTGLDVMDTLLHRNMVALPIERIDSIYHSGSQGGAILDGKLSKYGLYNDGLVLPSKEYELQVSKPVVDYVPYSITGGSETKDNRYREMLRIDQYDASGNIVQFTTTDKLPMSFLWGHHNTYPLAKVLNADIGNVAYSSFESELSGGWELDSSSITTISSGSITGKKAYQLNGVNSLQKSGLTNSISYTVSFWLKDGTGSALVNSANAVKKVNRSGWSLYEIVLSGINSIIISGSGLIDEVRLFPRNAQMSTFTYEPLIGITSQSDMNNRTQYFEYDQLGRLIIIRDQDRNILKSFEYGYQRNQ
ncbi:MAG: hypothetical protein HYU71_15865 [Bacteroidetes bacterium]|nr:hypothetical protein [Bacteroidota bacterium]